MVMVVATDLVAGVEEALIMTAVPAVVVAAAGLTTTLVALVAGEVASAAKAVADSGTMAVASVALLHISNLASDCYVGPISGEGLAAIS
jgi:hypothetical protein